ncbi:MAG: lipid-A-disaccharide synthase [Desulfomonile tiedjei]|uniref:Lipid-A-disaccharide synthase n=1 Tax=Desulfomonile tiedjei TaxID=2358 RepID=A0A9D6Z052_9BACT|nr:lipid-A-disaccharide synthase [Desulfomonile tiedjei]
MSSTQSILLMAGEASGDYHAAALVRDIKSIRPQVRVVGIGGDKLAAAGMELLHHYRDINTIGLSEGLGKVRNIIHAYGTMKRELRSGEHSLFVPVDFPDINIRLCGLAKKAGVPVYYYISPQVWAWRRGRIRKIAERVDRMMTIFPFEEKLYREAGVKADFVGHTMVRDLPDVIDRSAAKIGLGLEPSRNTVALVPGSRQAEIRRMLPRMCEAAAIFLGEFPDTLFVLPLAGPHLAGIVREILSQYAVPVEIHKAEASVLMAASDCGLVTSGTATLQAALAGMPHAVVYALDGLTWLIASKVLKPLVMDSDVHVAIANVLAINDEKDGRGPIKLMMEAGHRIDCQECGRPLFVPELLQNQATPAKMAKWLLTFRSDDSLRETMERGFSWMRQSLKSSQSGRTAADIILEFIAGK